MAENQQPARPTDRGSRERTAAVVRIAYDEAVRALNDQSSELSNLRTRTVSFIAFVASANAFLAGAVVKTPGSARDSVFYILTASASVCFLVLLVSAVRILSPRRRFAFTTEPRELLAQVDAEVGSSEAQYLSYLVQGYGGALELNDERLTPLRNSLLHLVVAGVAGTVLMVVVTWVVA